MPKIDIDALPLKTGTGYPAQFAGVAVGRSRRQLGNAGGLTQFGVNLCRLEPGAATSQRHWHHNEDEFVYVLEGEATLIEDDGETVLYPGDAATFKAGVENGHTIINRSSGTVVLLEVGTRAATEIADYPDIDLRAVNDGTGYVFTRKDGTKY